MTCVVAVKDTDGEILMGCDSASVNSWYSKANRADPKIYRIGGKMLIGFTTSFRMGQLLGYSMTLPQHIVDQPLEAWMATAFINAVRDCLKAGGWAVKEKEQEAGGNFLVAYRGRIFQIYGDYQVGERNEPFDAVGCGFELALGSLHTSALDHALAQDPRARVTRALESAAAFSAGVHPPFRIEVLAP